MLAFSTSQQPCAGMLRRRLQLQARLQADLPWVTRPLLRKIHRCEAQGHCASKPVVLAVADVIPAKNEQQQATHLPTCAHRSQRAGCRLRCTIRPKPFAWYCVTGPEITERAYGLLHTQTALDTLHACTASLSKSFQRWTEQLLPLQVPRTTC